MATLRTSAPTFRARLETWLTARWYGATPVALWLRGVSYVYAGLICLRRFLYQRGLFRSHRLSVPVVVIGNRVVGGTGKTPLTIALAIHLASQGWRPGLVSRGYGRTSKNLVSVQPGMSAELCGDEPLLMAQGTGLPVIVASDRIAAAQRLIDQGCNLILSDDGLQHWRLGRDLEIEVIDGERRYGNGLLLPAGPLRESITRPIALAVINGGAERVCASNNEHSMQLRISRAVSLNKEREILLGEFTSPVHAVAGIGNPARFFSALREQGLHVIEHAFPDHHAFVAEDFIFGDNLPIVMTEKDAVKCCNLDLKNAWSVPAEAEISAEFFAAVDRHLAALR